MLLQSQIPECFFLPVGLLRNVAVSTIQLSGGNGYSACKCLESEMNSHSFQIYFVQILSYMLLRSGIYSLRNYTSSFLKEVGSMSTWLYVSHYHILLANDGRGMLVLLPKLFIANAVVVVVVFALIFVVINSSLLTLNQVKSLFL